MQCPIIKLILFNYIDIILKYKDLVLKSYYISWNTTCQFDYYKYHFQESKYLVGKTSDKIVNQIILFHQKCLCPIGQMKYKHFNFIWYIIDWYTNI